MKPILVLAPIRGVTDRIFRNTFARHFPGFDHAVAPFIATSRRRSIDRRTLREFEQHANDDLCTIPQILGNNPEDFIQLANMLYDMGHGSVNWNLGCPFPMIAGKRKGSGLLCYPREIEDFLEQVIPHVKTGLSVKLRLGYRYPDEIHALIPIFNRYPLEEIIIHPRTGAQMYEGNADIERFAECLPLCRHEIVYNGDITTRAHFEILAGRFPSIKKWMIGRGALRDPFLPDSILTGTEVISYHERVGRVRLFHDDLFTHCAHTLHTPLHALDRMKELWSYLSRFFPDSERVFRKIRKTRSFEQYENATNGIFTLYGDRSREDGDKNSPPAPLFRGKEGWKK
jgi:tRNA-dihydrouridine synthase B